MALKFNRTGNILHVIETTHSLIKTQVRHWYYDVQNWRCSSHGREGDEIDRDMHPEAIEWVEKHYLPKVA